MNMKTLSFFCYKYTYNGSTPLVMILIFSWLSLEMFLYSLLTQPLSFNSWDSEKYFAYSYQIPMYWKLLIVLDEILKVLKLFLLTFSRSKFLITEKSAHFPNAKSCAIANWMVINMTRWPTVFILILNCRSMLLNWLSKLHWWKSSFLEFYIPKLSRFACLVFTNRNVRRLTIAWKSGNPVRSRMKAPWSSFWLNLNFEKMQHLCDLQMKNVIGVVNTAWLEHATSSDHKSKTWK